jgi:glucokinase
VRWYAEKFVFPPLAGSYRIVPAELGEEVVVHGAVALAGMEKGVD